MKKWVSRAIRNKTFHWDGLTGDHNYNEDAAFEPLKTLLSLIDNAFYPTLLSVLQLLRYFLNDTSSANSVMALNQK